MENLNIHQIQFIPQRGYIDALLDMLRKYFENLEKSIEEWEYSFETNTSSPFVLQTICGFSTDRRILKLHDNEVKRRVLVGSEKLKYLGYWGKK